MNNRILNALGGSLDADEVAELMAAMDEETVEHIVAHLPEEHLHRALAMLIDRRVIPHLFDIRERADGDVSTVEAREQLMDLGEDARHQLFFDTINDVVQALMLIRSQPFIGLARLKKLLRDPYTIEGLLLIFDHEGVEPAAREEMKDFVAAHVWLVGVAVLPEMYAEEERQEVRDILNIDGDLIDELTPEETAEAD